MNVKSHFVNIQELELEMTIKMKFSEWINLIEAMEDKHPGWQLKMQIKDNINKVRQEFRAELGDGK